MRSLKDKIILVKKWDHQNVYNSTTLVDDTYLHYRFKETGLYRVVVRCRCVGSSSADIKSAWTAGTGIALTTSRYCMGIGTNNGSPADRVDTMSVQHVSSLSSAIAYSVGWFVEEFFVIVTQTNGVLQFQWAQNTAVASNTTVYSNSHIIIEKAYWK